MKTKFNGILTLLLALVVQISFAQEKTVSGTVTDDSGGLPGVSVLIKGTTQGTDTDFDGKYSIKTKVGDVLVFSYVGYESVEKTVGSASVINVTMKAGNVLDEVVVVAYGTTTKEAFTGSANVVSSKDLAKRTVTSPIAAIEGKATGVQFISASGQPGSSPALIIRGVGTLSGGTAPLIILDGVPFQGGLNLINPEDIESMTVLKDAASTSLYGSRAANGVVIITTKSGKKGTLKVNASTSYAVTSKAVRNYETADARQYYELAWEAYKNSLGGPGNEAAASASIYNRLGYNPFNVPNDQIVGTDGRINPNAQITMQGLDWYDALERVGTRVNHNVSVSAGGENHQIFFSAGYLQEEGFVIESGFDRITTRINANFSPTEWLTIGGNMNMAITTNSTSATGGIVNPFAWAADLAPIYPVYQVDINGNIVTNAAGEKQYDLGEGDPSANIGSRPYNPGRHGIAEAIYNDNDQRNNGYAFTNYIEVRLAEGLKFKTTYSQQFQDNLSKRYENHIVGDGAPGGRYQETRFRRTVENFNQIFSYAKTFNDIHNFDATAGHESYSRNETRNTGLRINQTATGIYEFANFAAGDIVGGFSDNHRIEGYLARVNYNYDNKYYFSGSFRRDGTSRFSTDARWGNFFSVGGSWRIDQEKFMENVSFVDRLKIRGSYGEVGNESLPSFYASQALYAITPNAGVPGIVWNSTGNSLLNWENQVSWDVALEFSLFNNILDGSIEYYKKSSNGLLFNRPIPLSEGLNIAPENIGDMHNQGWELSLTGHIVKTNDFTWDMTVQASTVENEITQILSPVINGSKRWAEGRSRYDFYSYHFAGVDPANGDSLYYMYTADPVSGEQVPVLDANGAHSVTNDWQTADRAYTGDTSLPDVFGSVNSSFTYKQFTLDFLFAYGIGGKSLDNGYVNMMHPGTYGRALHLDQLNAWKQPGDITNIPRLETGDPNQTVGNSTRFLTDASYLALRNLNFGYSLNNDLSEKLGVDNLRFSVSAENLFINSKRRGLDPQSSLSGTPGGSGFKAARIISFGLNASF